MSRYKNIAKLLIFFISFSIFGLVLLSAFSYNANTSTETFISLMGDIYPAEKNKDFSYCLEVENVKQSQITDKERLNNRFYNYRDSIAIINESNLTFNNEKIYLSDTTQLSKEKSFVQAHLVFSSFDKSNICDMDYFSNPREKEGCFDKEKNTFSVILPSSIGKIISEEKHVNLSELLYDEFIFDNQSKNVEYRIAGIWDDSINARSYYNYNSFYAEQNKSVIFVNSTQYLFGDSEIQHTFLLLGNDSGQNLNFYHMFSNCIGGRPNVVIPHMKINTYNPIESQYIWQFYDTIINEYKSPNLLIYSIIFGVISVVLFICVFTYYKECVNEIKNSKIIKWIIYIIWPSAAVVSVLIFSLFSGLKMGYISMFSYSSVSLILLSLITILWTLISRFMLRDKEHHKEITLHNETNKDVCIVSFDDIYSNSAGATRINNFEKMFTNNGFTCSKIGYFKGNDELEKKNIYGTKNYKFKLFNYIASPLNYIIDLSTLDEKNNFKYLFIYSPLPLITSLFINVYGHWNNKIIIHDVCEFQNISQINWRRPGWFNVSNHIYNSLIISSGDRVISISTYLDKYFKSKNVQSIIIPPVFDPNAIKLIDKKVNNEKIIYTYLGRPGKKDNLAMCIEGFIQAFNETKTNYKYEVRFFGVKEKDYEKLFKNCPNNLKSIFIFNDLVKKEELFSIYSESSYIFFLRNPEKRFSKAGFPSKVVESLFYNVPIITNKTSDLQNYLECKKHVEWVEEYSLTSFKKTILDTINEYENYNLKYSNNCRELANEKFSLSTYENKLLSFFDESNSNEIGETNNAKKTNI